MKLLLCQECKDIFKLRFSETKYCHCKKSSGKYIDTVNVEIQGPCTLIGFPNIKFHASHMIHVLGKDDSGIQEKATPFEAFFIPDTAESVKRLDK